MFCTFEFITKVNKGNQSWIFIGSWSWNSNTLATWCEELTHWKRPWCWERLKVGGEGDNRGWDGWMASPTWWTWVWTSSGSWWRTAKPEVLQSMVLQRVGHDWATELNGLNWSLKIAVTVEVCLHIYMYIFTEFEKIVSLHSLKKLFIALLRYNSPIYSSSNSSVFTIFTDMCKHH